MKTLHVHLFYGNRINSSAIIFVEGLGEITIKGCFSEELYEQIRKEAELSLKIKLGQTVNCVSHDDDFQSIPRCGKSNAEAEELQSLEDSSCK